MALFVPLDVDYMSDPKIMRLKDPLSELLYVRALCFAKRTLSDGFIHDAQLLMLCTGFGRDMARPGRMVDRLVRDLDATGLWRRVQDGYVIVAWSKRNTSAATIKAASEKRRLAGQKANHERWHVNGKVSSDCPFCIRTGSESDVSGYPIRSESDSTETEPETESDTSDRIDVSTARTVTRIGAAAEALELYADIDLSTRSITEIRNPRSYRRSTITNAAREYGPAIEALIATIPDASVLDILTGPLGVDPFTARSAINAREQAS